MLTHLASLGVKQIAYATLGVLCKFLSNHFGCLLLCKNVIIDMEFIRDFFKITKDVPKDFNRNDILTYASSAAFFFVFIHISNCYAGAGNCI